MRQVFDQVIASEAKPSPNFRCLNEIASASANGRTPRNDSQISNQSSLFVRASLVEWNFGADDNF